MRDCEWDASAQLWRDANGKTYESIEPIKVHMQTSELLDTRGTTHGNFEMNALVGQRLRELFRECATWQAMPEVPREALDMIACKVSRILSGQANFEDHWADIAGYAELARKACKK